MEEAIGDVRTRRESVTFDKTSVTELRVKQKYMGHRNARYIHFHFCNFNLVVAND